MLAAPLASAKAATPVGTVEGSISTPHPSATPQPTLSSSQVFAGPSVSNEAGDTLEVKATRPGAVVIVESGDFSCGPRTTPYRGSDFTTCGEVYAYDAKLESTRVPDTNSTEEQVWDACGTYVGRRAGTEWHDRGSEYMQTPAWAGGGVFEVPPTEPTACLGTWRALYTFTETFSDGEQLSASIEGTFTVTSVAIEPSATWGGGNPTELCSQICRADPVNTATGDYTETVTDLSLPGRGPALAMTRTYSSLAAHAEVASTLGLGWSSNYGAKLNVDSTTGVVTIKNVNGSQTIFEPSGGGYAAPPRILATLVHNEDGTWTYTVRQRTIYTFNSSGKLATVADLNGNAITLTYNEAGLLQTAADSAGRYLSFEYNKGVISTVSDSSGRSVSYEYDSYYRLARVTDLRGEVTAYTYDAAGLLRTRLDPREHIVLTNKYDEGGRVLSQTDALENKTSYSYTWEGPIERTDVTDPRGYVTKYEYNEGALAAKTEAKGTESAATWTYEHDPSTEGITSVTDPNNHTSHTTYDSRGNKTSTEDALGDKSKSAYDSLDNLTEYTDANGVTTTYEYDKRGNRLKVSTPLVGSEPPQARTITYAHEDEAHPGDVTAITDPNGKTTHYTYDAAGNLTSVTDPEGDKTTYTYNEIGQRLTQVSPRGNVDGATPAEYTTTYTYDAAGNRLTATDPLGHERKWTYDADGNLETETDPNGHKTSFLYNADNEQIKVEKPNGDTTETAYDANGNVSSQTDGLKHATTYAYDPLDHLSSSTDPLSRETTYVYDGVGNPTSKKDAEGRTTTYGYDSANRLTKVSYSDGTTPTVEYGYDADGHRTSMKDGSGESSFKYDSLGRMVEAGTGYGATTSYGYDLAGNETSITYPNGKEVTRNFDNAERMTSVSDWLGNTTSFAYDPNSNLLSTTFPQGTSNVDEYAYNRSNQMSEVKLTKGAETLASLAYGRDKVGQVESVTSKGLPGSETEAIGYDINNRLTKAGSESFGYDAANNLTEAAGTTSTYDAANELERRDGTAIFGYDRLGERTSEASSAAAFASSFGSPGSGNGHFERPAGIAVDAEGNLWVVDSRNNRVQEFNRAGEYMTSFGSNGSKRGEFFEPAGIAIDSEGDLWVVDRDHYRVEEFNQSGKFLTSFGKQGEGNGEFSLPESIAINSQGDIWVGDCCDGRVQEFTSKGKFIRLIGTHGTGKGEIWSPVGLAIDASGDVWVADFGNKRLEEFSEEGKFLQEFGTKGSGDGEFKGPGAISIDGEGHIWVVDDEGNERVEEFTQGGEYLGRFGSPGSGEGQFGFEHPMGMATDPEGGIWVSDETNDRVQHWQVAERKAATSYRYDQAGDLTAVERPKAGEAPAIEESYTYDGTGLRASQTVSGTTSNLTWDQSGGLPLLLSNGSTNYIYGPAGLPIEQIFSETPNYYHHDQLGSTRMLTNSSGEATATFSYGAYGQQTGSTGTQTTPLGFAGQLTNEQSGLIYMRSRVYDPATGQFLTRDPIEELTRAPYGYAAGNPLRYVDPSGTGPCVLGFIACDESDNPCEVTIFNPAPLPCLLPEGAQQPVINATAGFGDQASFGLTKLIRSAMGTNGVVNECSIWYHGGQAAGFLAQLGVALSPTVTAMADYWSLKFAERYPGVANYLALHGEDMYELSGPARFYLEWIASHLPR